MEIFPPIKPQYHKLQRLRKVKAISRQQMHLIVHGSGVVLLRSVFFAHCFHIKSYSDTLYIHTCRLGNILHIGAINIGLISAGVLLYKKKKCGKCPKSKMAVVKFRFLHICFFNLCILESCICCLLVYSHYKSKTFH